MYSAQSKIYKMHFIAGPRVLHTHPNIYTQTRANTDTHFAKINLQVILCAFCFSGDAKILKAHNLDTL